MADWYKPWTWGQSEVEADDRPTTGYDPNKPGGHSGDARGSGGVIDTAKDIDQWMRGTGPDVNNEFRDPNYGNFLLPGYGDRRRWLGEQYQAYDRRAPQAGQSTFRGDQQALLDQLRRRASGEDSLSQLQLKENLGQNLRQQQAMAASARPGQGGLATRAAAQQMGQLGAGLAGQQAQAGIQERAAAQGLLGQFAGQARGQDLQREQMNLQAMLQQQGLDDAQRRAIMGQMMQNAALMQQGKMGYEAQRGQRFANIVGVPGQPNPWLGAALGLGSAAMMGG